MLARVGIVGLFVLLYATTPATAQPGFAYSWPSSMCAPSTFLQCDGTGNLTWALGGGGSPGPTGSVGPTGATGPTGASGSPTLDCTSTLNALHSCTVRLTPTDLASTAPVTVVPAPGPNKVIWGRHIAMTYQFGTVAYNQDPGTLYLDPTFVVAERLLAPGPFADGQTVDGLFHGYFGEGNAPSSVIAGQPMVFKMMSTGTGAMTATVAASGSLYAVDDTGFISGCGRGDAGYTITGVDGGGAVTSIALDGGRAGSGYDLTHNPCTTTPGLAQPGGGSGLTLNITGIMPSGDGYLNLIVDYRVLPLPTTTITTTTSTTTSTT